MKTFLNNMTFEEIRKMTSWEILDGFTTNPTLLSKENRIDKSNDKKAHSNNHYSLVIGNGRLTSNTTVSNDSGGYTANTVTSSDGGEITCNTEGSNNNGEGSGDSGGDDSGGGDDEEPPNCEGVLSLTVPIAIDIVVRIDNYHKRSWKNLVISILLSIVIGVATSVIGDLILK